MLRKVGGAHPTEAEVQRDDGRHIAMTDVAVVGASGYAARELFRLIERTPWRQGRDGDLDRRTTPRGSTPCIPA